VPSSAAAGTSTEDTVTWARLVRDLRAAKVRLEFAMAELGKAERRYFALPRSKRRPPPDWYQSAQHAETLAGDGVEEVSHRIARTRARGREGLAIKVQLLAEAYGQMPENSDLEVPDPDDLVACLIRSLITDLS
jgi:hypothetical protein